MKHFNPRSAIGISRALQAMDLATAADQRRKSTREGLSAFLMVNRRRRCREYLTYAANLRAAIGADGHRLP